MTTPTKTSQPTIRRGERGDLPSVLSLIKELAVYEKAANEVEVTLEELKKDGFGPSPLFFFFVAENQAGVIGVAFCYWKYSTWKGRCLFLEDFVVKEAFRGSGAGKLLFEAVIQEAKAHEVRRLEWQVLDWNESAIRFYKKYNSVLDPTWINGQLTGFQIQNFQS